MARTYQVISADGHLETPPHEWVKYVPKAYQPRAPRLIELPEGGQAMVVEGQPLLHIGTNMSGGRRPIKLRNASYWDPDGTPVPGTGSPAQRLREQDQDGIDAEVLFPPLFATTFVEGIADRPVYLAMIQAYNTYLGEEYCAVAPDRLIGCGVIPISGIEDAVAELKRCKELGLRAVTPLQFPNGSGGPKPEDDRFWETALSLGMAVAPHVRLGDRRAPATNTSAGSSGNTFAVHLVRQSDYGPVYTLTQMMAAGVFDRFPALRIYLAETNAGWLPATLYMLDDSYRRLKDTYGVEFKRLPSEYVRQNFLFGIICDPLAIRLKEHLPVENLMWGNDFPHSVGSFPESRKWLDIIFDGATPALRRKVLLENPAAFFGLKLNQPITPTPPTAAVGERVVV